MVALPVRRCADRRSGSRKGVWIVELDGQGKIGARGVARGVTVGYF